MGLKRKLSLIPEGTCIRFASRCRICHAKATSGYAKAMGRSRIILSNVFPERHALVDQT